MFESASPTFVVGDVFCLSKKATDNLVAIVQMRSFTVESLMRYNGRYETEKCFLLNVQDYAARQAELAQVNVFGDHHGQCNRVSRGGRWSYRGRILLNATKTWTQNTTQTGKTSAILSTTPTPTKRTVLRHPRRNAGAHDRTFS